MDTTQINTDGHGQDHEVKAEAGFFFSELRTVDSLIGERQGALMDALSAYNAAVDAARVLEPHVARVKLIVDFLDESPRCDTCGGKL